MKRTTCQPGEPGMENGNGQKRGNGAGGLNLLAVTIMHTPDGPMMPLVLVKKMVDGISGDMETKLPWRLYWRFLTRPTSTANGLAAYRLRELGKILGAVLVQCTAHETGAQTLHEHDGMTLQ